MSMFRSGYYILENYIPKNGEGRQWVQIFSIFVAALGALSSGAIGAWTSPAILILTSNSSHIQPISLEEASYFTVIPPIALIISAPFISLPVDRLGRQKTIMLLATFQFLSWMTVAFANSLSCLYLARIFGGLGDATFFGVVPFYIGEITEPNVRSTWGNLMAFFAFLGQFLINVVGSYCSIVHTAYIFCCAPLIQFLLTFVLPESPYYLLMKGKENEAKMSMKILRWTNNIDDKFSTLSKDVQQQITETGTYKDLFCNSTHRKILIIAAGIRASQQLSGLPAFFSYTQYIFSQAGGNFSASLSAIIFSGVFMIIITIFSFFIGKFGRKPLLMLSCFSCGIVMGMEAIYFYIFEKTSINVSNLTWLPLAGMIAYVPANSVGLAIIPTLILGELFATNIKSKAMSVLNICFAILIIVVTKVFQVLVVNFGMYVPFCLFSTFCFLNVMFCYYCVPETKGKTLEEIQENLKRHKN